jgi:hypothetical protein
MWTLIGDKPTETLGIIGDITRASKSRTQMIMYFVLA